MLPVAPRWGWCTLGVAEVLQGVRAEARLGSQESLQSFSTGRRRDNWAQEGKLRV